MHGVVPVRFAFFFVLSVVLLVGALTAAGPVRAQVISGGDTTIDPTSKIHLKGQFPYSGKIWVHFHEPSAVAFGDCSKTDLNTSKNDLYLDYDAQPNATEIESKQSIDEVSLVGDVPEQTVDITVVIAEHGSAKAATSNPWHANFQNKAVIVQGPATVGYNTSFNLCGWDFGEPGKLRVHFTNNDFKAGLLDGKSDLTIAKPNWNHAWIINATTPPLGGLIEQPVEISLTTKDGRTSNTWPAKFEPRMVLMPVLEQDVQVISCSNGGDVNACNDNNSSLACFIPNLNVIGTAGPPDSVNSVHTGCFGFSSDSGTDQYLVSVNAEWRIVQIDTSQPTINGSVQLSTPSPPNMANPGSITPGNYGFVFAGSYAPVPSRQVTLYANWHIGATGGEIGYFANVMIKGPYGVPYQQP
jgi:hypothetical protein